MKKISFATLALFAGILSAFAQPSPTVSTADSGNYQNRKLKFEEVSLVSSYYKQDGNNSAVEGGVGTEQLTDLANVIDIKFSRYDKKSRKHSYTLEAGLDNYSSASSDMIDSKANSSASSADTRIYPSLAWMLEDEKKGRSMGLNVNVSTEYDYKSLGFGASFGQKSKDRNREVAARAQVYLDKVSMILPEELRANSNVPAREARNSYSLSLSLSQVINKRLQVLFIADVVQQNGFLALPFHRVYLDNGAVRSEKLPSSRLKLPLGARANYFLGDHLILRSFYRFYSDNWGLIAHTLEFETVVKFSAFFSLTPFYRYYDQTAIDYFEPKAVHKPSDEFYTSNYDLSAFHSGFYGLGFRVAPPKGILGIKHWSNLEVRYGHYQRSTGLSSDIVSLNLGVK